MIPVVIKRLAVIALSLLLAPAAALASDPQFVGFLEDRLEPAVRLAFQKTPGGWKSFCPPEEAITSPDSCHPHPDRLPKRWTAIYRGEPKGVLETSAYQPRFVSDVGLYTVDDPDAVPRVGEQDREFSGQIDHTGYRPLVSVSLPSYSDPQKWVALKPEDVDVAQLWPAFKQRAGAASTCEADPDGEEKTVPWDYHMKDVQVFQAYTSQSGARLVALQFDPSLNTCDGPRAREWSTFWFYMDPNSHLHPLNFAMRNAGSSPGYMAKVLDWGDYDGDGSSEMVFWVESNNQDGYVLFYENFAKQAVFTWIYR